MGVSSRARAILETNLTLEYDLYHYADRRLSLQLEVTPSSTTTEELARARTPSCRRTSPTSDCGRRKEREYVSVLGGAKIRRSKPFLHW